MISKKYEEEANKEGNEAIGWRKERWYGTSYKVRTPTDRQANLTDRQARTHIYIHTYLVTYIHAYMCIYTHTRTHTYIHSNC